MALEKSYLTKLIRGVQIKQGEKFIRTYFISISNNSNCMWHKGLEILPCMDSLTVVHGALAKSIPHPGVQHSGWVGGVAVCVSQFS
jgi:hypothetical protein